MRNKEDKAIKGRVLEALPSMSFNVSLDDGSEILAYLSGKMRLHYIKVFPGDIVLLELSPDKKRGRIIRRI